MRHPSFLCLLVVTTWLAACDTSHDVTLLFDRNANDPTRHIFPTDRYAGEVVLDGFSEAQVALLPFLGQLRYTAQLGWAPTTAVRLPFTPDQDDPSRWIDVASVPDAVRIHRVDLDTPEAVPHGEIRLQQRTNAVVIRPRAPWAPGRYAVAVLRGELRTRGGGSVSASADANLVARDGDSQTDADFAAVAGVDPTIADRGDTLVFFTFTVADATGQMRLLKAYLSGLAPVDWQGRDELLDITPILPAETRELAVGGAKVVADNDAAIAAVFESGGAGALPKDKIGKIVGGAIATPVFVSDPQPDPLQLFFNGTFLARRPLEPFNPQNPLSVSRATPTRLLPYLMFVPKVHAPELPVIIAIHGITRSKEDWLSFANTACATGHALVAIDLYQHGERQADIAVPEGNFSTKVDPVLAAGGVNFPDPFINPTFLARTRDKLRQSIVDNLALVRLLSAGDGQNPLIDFDGDGTPDHIGPIRLVAHSLGAMLATPLVAVSPEIDRALLNVPGAHITQIINDSPRLAKDIDVLVYATANAQGIGLLAGSPRFMVPDGAERELLTEVSDTILAAVDPASYAGAIVSGALGGSAPRVLVQFALGDDVVTNRANVRYAQALAGGADSADEVVAVGPELFPTGLSVVTLSQLLPPVAVTQFEGGHGLLLDFADPAVTAAAQQQAGLFLASP
jgi:hypothetical protein